MIKAAWERVTRDHVLRAISEYDRLGPEQFFVQHGFGPTMTYDLVHDKRRYPPKAFSARPMSSPAANGSIPQTSRAASLAR